MKLFIIFFLFSTCNTFGQELLDTQYYLYNNLISKNAKDFYRGKFSPSDNTRTISIMDSLNTKNNVTRPFYILLVSKMLKKSDGALSESLGVNCRAFLESHPDFLLDFLYSKKLVTNKYYFDKWAKQIAMEFSLDCEEKKLQCINDSKRQTATKTKSTNQSRLNTFYGQIVSYCH